MISIHQLPQAHDDFEGNGSIPAWAEDGEQEIS